MDWIEKIFGIAPDNGDGSAEAMIVAAALVIASILVVAASPALRAYAFRHLDNVVGRFRR